MGSAPEHIDMSLDDIIKGQRKKAPAKPAAPRPTSAASRQRRGKKVLAAQTAQVKGEKDRLAAAVQKRGKAQRAAKLAKARGMEIDTPAAQIVAPRKKLRAVGKAKISPVVNARTAAAVARKKGKGVPATAAKPAPTARSIKIIIPGAAAAKRGGAPQPVAAATRKPARGPGRGATAAASKRAGRGAGVGSGRGRGLGVSRGIVKPGQQVAAGNAGVKTSRLVKLKPQRNAEPRGSGLGGGVGRGRAQKGVTLSQRFGTR